MKGKAIYIIGLMIAMLFAHLHVTAAEVSLFPSTVKTAYGLIQGASHDGIVSFKGIPYAAPPVGEYRWRAPQPAKRWKGVLDATQFRSAPAQAGWQRNGEKMQKGSSEDCLYLNIWRPETSSSEKLPVMVWIYGGGFVGGNGADPMFDGTEFAKHGVLFVTFNYRLGRLGHFAFPALSAEHLKEAKGSYAYMDQIAALQWVHDNIASFGGDPDNVTIFGESAGGVSVHAMMTIPAAKGLFQKAIIESGGGRDGVLSPRPIKENNASPYYPVSAEQAGINFARRHGIYSADAKALKRLRALPVEEIVDGGIENVGDTLLYSGPIGDGTLVKESAESAYYGHRENRVQLMIGSNSAEVSGGFIRAKDKEELLRIFGDHQQEAIDAYDAHNLSFQQLMTQVTTDKVWAEPARFTARTLTADGKDAYVYQFGYVPASMQGRTTGAWHGSEIPYAFGNLNTRWGAGDATSEDKAVSAIMQTYWVNFAKTGDPNKGSNGVARLGENGKEGSAEIPLPLWEKNTSKNDAVMLFCLDGHVRCIPNPKKARLDVVEKAFGK